jgi:hypothetical protein
MRKVSFNHILGLHMRSQPIEAVCANILRAALPSFSHDHIDGALSGDQEAAGMLAFTNNNMRPLVLSCLYACCPDSAGFREGLADIWGHDGPIVLQNIDNDLLRSMFECGGQPPLDLPKLVTVYRGGQNDFDKLRRGWSWTTDRRVAAWFALRFLGSPLVIKANVRSSSILHGCNERREKEVVIAGGVRRATISGTPGDWEAEAAAWHADATKPYEQVF